jgi:hypothetical protein
MKIFFIVCVWMMVNTITMLIFANYLLGRDENQTSISKSNTNNTPFVSIKTKSEKDETIKEKNKILHPKSKN